ncbi:hypothetical protein SUGI_0705580 [Cryptomeria japonica]|uniref:coniferyl alcohol acyltransferase-like n=1 Tax=Cryptomeria japonica TaxID=3369 RepID=UPI002414CBAC|nr:coniferyl alcohol acyltransferase-like [Cryptomeria japonica]GLJ35066.1 hypothetical protein SUGI_0705580 [Cryptomeria japonica]
MASVNSLIFKDYELKIVNTDVIVPALPMQQHILPLSNLDLTIPPVSVHVFFCYKNPFPRTFGSALSHLRNSLSRVLASYYVFAGRLVTDSISLPKLHCNSKGVLMTQAYAAAPLSTLDLYNPDESVEGKLVPLLSKPSEEDCLPVFAVQVTEFSCGGIVVGCTFDHRIADAYSANMLFTSWAKISRNDSTVSPNPTFSRSKLCPRDSPTCCAELKIYKDGKNYTKLEVFSAYLWKLLICTQKVQDTLNCKIGIVVDGRPRLRAIGVSANYFGNVLILPFAESNAHYVRNKPLCWSAGLIHDAIQSAANEENFQSLIDLVETTKPTPVLPKIYCRGDGKEPSGPAVLVSSGLRFPLYEFDYGWRKPTFGSYHFPWGGEAGYVMPTHSPAGDGSWIVYMHLPLKKIYAIESDLNRVLVPIQQDFLASA